MSNLHTFALLNPGYESCWGKIIDKVIEENIVIVQMKMLYLEDEIVDKLFFDKIKQQSYPAFQAFMTSGSVIAMELAANDVINRWSELIGPTVKESAVEHSPDSLTALYAKNSNEPVCYGPSNIDDAIYDLTVLFGSAPEEMIPELEPANFEEDENEELTKIESIASRYEKKDYSRRVLKQEYLESTVMPLVLEGLSWIIKERPNDPIEHLAMFLLKNNTFGKSEEKEQSVSGDVKVPLVPVKK